MNLFVVEISCRLDIGRFLLLLSSQCEFLPEFSEENYKVLVGSGDSSDENEIRYVLCESTPALWREVHQAYARGLESSLSFRAEGGILFTLIIERNQLVLHHAAERSYSRSEFRVLVERFLKLTEVIPTSIIYTTEK